jgi:anti-anti-sigma regulatory factor
MNGAADPTACASRQGEATVLDATALGADTVTLEALARLARAARRAGRRLVVRHASPELTTLLSHTGFTASLVSIEQQPPSNS